MSKAGRRTIHFSGLCCQCVLLVIVGSLSFAAGDGALWAIGALLVLFTFICKFVCPQRILPTLTSQTTIWRSGQ